MDFKSHPDKLLIDHLREVGDNAEALAPSHLKKAAYIAGSHHDIGKFTSFFQEHLNSGRKMRCSSHASISALYAFDTAKREGLDDLTSFLVMSAVKSHHGRLLGLKTMKNWLRGLMDGEDECLRMQYEQIRNNASDVKSLRFPPKLDMDLDKIVSNAWRTTMKLLQEFHNWRDYFNGALLFSCLIDADKHSASNNPFSTSISLPLERVMEFHDNLPNGNMKDLRDMLYYAVLNWKLEGRIAGIISPTGTGKTLAGILAAVKEGRRVIYSLPFISIVEQTYDIVDSIYPDQVLKFHHMAFPDPNSDENVSVEDILLLAESWDYPMIVTTFEGLLASFLSHRNRDIKRLHSLYGSVVILDEVQALPAEKWNIIKEALKEASETLDIKFILMSATVPKLLRPESGNIIDPLYGREPNRVRVNYRDKIVTPEELAKEVVDIWKGNESIMVELNTIASAERVADELLRSEIPIQFLSTHITPYDRRNRINKMKEMLRKGDPFVLVTTQVVEAGVDLDFSKVFRDLGPLDSVIQAAGRCNRNSRLAKGEVFIRRIRREDKPTDFSLIYGKFTEQVTLKIIKESFEEKDFRKMLDSYYEELEKIRDLEHQSIDVIDHVKSLDYDKLEFSLIKEEPKYAVLILQNNKAMENLNGLRSAMRTRGYERSAAVRKWRANVEEFTVKVWQKPELEYDERLDLYLANADIYDSIKGFTVKETEESLLW